MSKSGREIMEIFEAFDLTGTAWSAAQLTGCDAKTVARYVAVRDAGGDPGRAPQPRLRQQCAPCYRSAVRNQFPRLTLRSARASQGISARTPAQGSSSWR
jgi:hypothetical protein